MGELIRVDFKERRRIPVSDTGTEQSITMHRTIDAPADKLITAGSEALIKHSNMVANAAGAMVAVRSIEGYSGSQDDDVAGDEFERAQQELDEALSGLSEEQVLEARMLAYRTLYPEYEDPDLSV